MVRIRYEGVITSIMQIALRKTSLPHHPKSQSASTNVKKKLDTMTPNHEIPIKDKIWKNGVGSIKTMVMTQKNAFS